MRVSGPLACWEAPYRSWLAAQGFAPRTIRDVLFHLQALSRWLEHERLPVDELTPERAQQFERARLAAGYSRRSARRTRLPLRFLREVDAVPAIPAAPPTPDGPVERVLADYRRYLVRERALVQGTIGRYMRDATLFVEDCVARGVALEDLTAAHVSGFLARECPARNPPAARNLACGLRALLRYLHVAGAISAPLRFAVPPVAQLRDQSLPRAVDRATVAKLLASCDRRRTVGRRDYAIYGAPRTRLPCSA
jgi:site-specific recombinase XerD